MKSLKCCGSRNNDTSIIPNCGNFITIGKMIENKDPIQLMFSSGCFGCGTAVRLFWTSTSYYLRDGRLKAFHLNKYLLLSVASFPWMMAFMPLSYPSLLSFMILGDNMFNIENFTLFRPILRQFLRNYFICKSLNKLISSGRKYQIISLYRTDILLDSTVQFKRISSQKLLKKKISMNSSCKYKQNFSK